jgi:3-polyprenyl-4-hydroxybenzoate decarboxylase
MLQALQEMPHVETHLIMRKYGRMNIELETDYSPQEVEAIANYCARQRNWEQSLRPRAGFLYAGQSIHPLGNESCLICC